MFDRCRHDWEVIESFTDNDISREARRVAFPNDDPYMAPLSEYAGNQPVAKRKVCLTCEIAVDEAGPLIAARAKTLQKKRERRTMRRELAQKIWDASEK